MFSLLLLLSHDLWIEPSTFHPQPGALVSLRLKVGQDFIGDQIARDPALAKQFVVDDGTRRVEVVSRPGVDLFQAASPGLQVVGYLSHPSSVELDAAKFHAYLKEEGLEPIIALRERRGQAAAPVRELFARCAKSLVRTGVAPVQDRVLGFPLELIAEKGGFRLLYQGKPLANALVVALHRIDPSKKQMMRTDADGRVRIDVSLPGKWLIKAVHMIPAPVGQGADWLSYWASLTFDTPKDERP